MDSALSAVRSGASQTSNCLKSSNDYLTKKKITKKKTDKINTLGQDRLLLHLREHVTTCLPRHHSFVPLRSQGRQLWGLKLKSDVILLM